jgi:hypothetical protein
MLQNGIEVPFIQTLEFRINQHVLIQGAPRAVCNHADISVMVVSFCFPFLVSSFKIGTTLSLA